MNSKRRFVLLGHPVGHSVSPQIHQSVYEELGVTAQYVAVDCVDESVLAEHVQAIRDGRLSGANVTVPHKRAALRLADDVAESARATRAANVLVSDGDGRVVAHNTDAAALQQLITRGVSSVLRDAVVLGSGGAALAAVVACRQAGAERVYISSRSWLPSNDAWTKADQFVELGATPCSWVSLDAIPLGKHRADSVALAALHSQVVIQASSAGMLGVPDGAMPCQVVPFDEMERSAFCYDVVYNPPVTPFLERAARSGLSCEGGLSMLVGQAALAIELWLGQAPNRERMMVAARRAIFGGSSATTEAKT